MSPQRLASGAADDFVNAHVKSCQLTQELTAKIAYHELPIDSQRPIQTADKYVKAHMAILEAFRSFR